MLRKYREYPDYKDTNVFWLGCVPKHWVLSKLKYIKDIVPNAFVDGPFGSNLKSSHVVEGGDIYVIESNFATQGILDEAKLKTITFEHFDTICRSEAKEGDIIIAKIGAQFGKASILPSIRKRAVVSGNSLKLSINEIIFSKLFAHYIFIFLKESGAFDDIVNATAQPALTLGDLNNTHIPFPLLIEQQKITNFLDHETAKIDTLIEKQQQLIKLLKEKRQAVISHAVTKGLNPNAPMRDSGVEWLGEMPEHWDKSSLGFECSVKARLGWKGLKAEEYVDEGYIFLATPNIKDNNIDFENVNYITKERYDESPEIMLEVGDVLVTKDGSTTGTTNVVRDLPAPSTVNSSIAVLRCADRLKYLYLYYFFVSTYIQNIIKHMQGGMGVPHLFQADLRKFNILMPPLGEQDEIVDYIESRLPKFDKLIGLANTEVTLLSERRTALISAAVTGKIDVRNWNAPQHNNKEDVA